MSGSWDPLEPPVPPEQERSVEVSSDAPLDTVTEPDVLVDDPTSDIDPEPIDLDDDTELVPDADPGAVVTADDDDPDAGIELAPEPELGDDPIDDPADDATTAPIDLTDGDDAPDQDDGTTVPELAPIDLTGDDADTGDAAATDPMTPIDLADPDDGETAPAADPTADDMTLADHLGARMIEGEPVEWTLESVCGSQAEAFAVVVAEPPRDAAPAADDRDDGPGPWSRDRVVAHDAVDGLDGEELVAEAIRTASADAVERPDKLGTLTDRVAEPHGDAPKPPTPAQDPGPVVTMVTVTHVDPTTETVTLDVDGERVTLDFADIRSVLDREPTAYRVDRRDVTTDVAVGIGSAALTLAPLALGRLIQRRRRGAPADRS